MTYRIPLFAAILSTTLTCTGLRAEAPKPGSREALLSFDPNLRVAQPTVEMSVFLDAVYDYKVYSAPDVSGQTEFVVMARFANGEWDYIHRTVWNGTPDHGMFETDMGVWKFTTSWSARQAAENMLDDGKITDYEIIEQPKEPQWTYEETFDTRAAAEDFADELEEWSQAFGVPHITKIVPVEVLKLRTTTSTR
jgi:hypothetical protein